MGADGEIELSTDDLRAVAAFAAGCAEAVLPLFEVHAPGDPRPREAIAAARRFAGGAPRGRGLREAAWAAQRAAGGVSDPAAVHAARAALGAAAAGYLHPLARATQVRHVLGPAAQAARAAELTAGDDPACGERWIRERAALTPAAVVAVLRRYPPAPPGGGRVGVLTRVLDDLLRGGQDSSARSFGSTSAP